MWCASHWNIKLCFCVHIRSFMIHSVCITMNNEVVWYQTIVTSFVCITLTRAVICLQNICTSQLMSITMNHITNTHEYDYCLHTLIQIICLQQVSYASLHSIIHFTYSLMYHNDSWIWIWIWTWSAFQHSPHILSTSSLFRHVICESIYHDWKVNGSKGTAVSRFVYQAICETQTHN